MTPAEFTTAAARTRLRADGIARARRVLVDGADRAQVAREAGVAWPTVRRQVDAVVRAHLGEQGLPEDWEVVTVAVPSGCGQVVQEFARRLASSV